MSAREAPKQKIVTFAPRLKRALIAAVERDGTNMNDVAVAVLAERFNCKFEPSGMSTPGLDPRIARTGLLLPADLKRKIRIEAARRDVYDNALIVQVLEEHFGLRKAA
jgi:hypothetical protein